jgi:hypothetical protein
MANDGVVPLCKVMPPELATKVGLHAIYMK